jgi:hypothetical protein
MPQLVRIPVDGDMVDVGQPQTLRLQDVLNAFADSCLCG